jgi:hypothetical protein
VVLVAVDDRRLSHHAGKRRVDVFGLFGWNQSSSHAIIALHRDQNPWLRCALAALGLLAVLPVLRRPAEIFEIDFHDARERRSIAIVHHCPDRMTEPPGRRLRDPEEPGHHHGRDTLARCDNEIHRLYPDRQRQLCGVQRRPCCHGVLASAIAALLETRPATRSGQIPMRIAAAVGAERTLRPPKLFQQTPTRCLGWILPSKTRERRNALWDSGHDDPLTFGGTALPQILDRRGKPLPSRECFSHPEA